MAVCVLHIVRLCWIHMLPFYTAAVRVSWRPPAAFDNRSREFYGVMDPDGPMGALNLRP